MKAYKGFSRDMKCRGFQYKEGKEYATDKAEICECGFHACEHPLDTFRYYEPAKSVYHEVELGGELSRRENGGTKVAGTRIKIGARLDIPGLVKAAFDFVRARYTNENNAEPGKPASACWKGAASAGASGAASAGEYGAACSRGSSAVESNGVAVARGNGVKVKGGLGSVLVLVEERTDNYDVAAWKAFRVDGRKYKADTWYSLKNGKVVEA